LEQISNPVNSLLEFGSLHLVGVLLIRDLFRLIESGWLRFLEWVISQSLNDADHLGYWCDDNLLGIILEEQSTSCKDNTGENCSEELEHGCFLTLHCDSNSGVSDELLAVFNCAIVAFLGCVHDQTDLFYS